MKTAIALLAFALTGLAVSASEAAPRHAPADREAAHFAPCGGGLRVTCVVDGDTLWYRGTKIRLADINAPELSSPHCRAEARLGARAAGRLADLLNAGGFSLQPIARAQDAYGRRLLVVTRGGESLGAMLTAEGLAEPWQGHRRDWCRA
ncbi:thermonuclease family protein [Novosphingobium sp. JCM 18896]|uniref:thermonuclease family protein n=1 Tax=Novosphingobium sp. JCM 18896 TaxID=2989731 RepID=UPI0022228172|nr:thermonuclease family protein [Novosphingobium sp. JCM 18896]MCW1431520.1 thermonuclease family protein [Novosphingobium sp. JCM 18896]